MMEKMIIDDFSKKMSKYKLVLYPIFKMLIFLVIGVSIFDILQTILVPKRCSYLNTYDSGKLSGFYNEEKNEIDILIEGTSHSAGGILPMELYEKYGIKSYNLATGIQSIEVSYYMACEALRTQKPKVLILDVGNLYISDATEFYWRMVLDEMHFGRNKFKFANEYCKQHLDMDKLEWEIMFPLFYYHENWKILSQRNFRNNTNTKRNYDKGGIITSTIAPAGLSVEYMNEVAENLLKDNERFLFMYEGEEYTETYNENKLYSVDIPDKNIEYFKKLQELCDANGVKLLAVKVPSLNLPQSYRSAWTREKYNKVNKICEEMGIEYYDIMYEACLEIDWGEDTWDGGPHLNLNGARKISADLGNYLTVNYDLPNEPNEMWDKDLELYQEVRNVALLELEKDFITYINLLINECNDKIIFIAASDDMSNGLNEIDINILRLLGLRVDFSQALNNSYIAVIDNGEVRYEALSNRSLNYEGFYGLSNKKYEIYSSGWYTNSQASIKLDGIEYVVNSRGLNIVVYDVQRDLVVDSVCFDTHTEYHTSVRNNSIVNGLRQKFEQYIVEVEDQL